MTPIDLEPGWLCTDRGEPWEHDDREAAAVPSAVCPDARWRNLPFVALCATLLLSACTTAAPEAQDQYQDCRPPAYCGAAVNYEAHGQSY